jgi:nicotinamide-nucleotide amidase
VIKEFSVVSEAVASAMASRTRQIMNTDYAITTGNAGPTKEMITPKSDCFYPLATPMRLLLKNNFGQPVIK